MKKIKCDGCNVMVEDTSTETMEWDAITITSQKLGSERKFILCSHCAGLFYCDHVPDRWGDY